MAQTTAPRSRMPELALPFALVGAAGGWISAGFLANPLIHVIATGQQGAAALCSAGVAALVGKVLTRWCVRTDPFAGPHVLRYRLLGSVIFGGAASGGITGGVTGHNVNGVLSGLLNGALCSLAFLPICAAVLAAARRAERARLGSIVAGADRREVWAILAAALAVATLAALPDWPASQSGLYPVPHVALAMAIGAGLLTLAIFIADAIAFVRVDRASRGADLAERDPAEFAEETAVPRVDLGLGDSVLAQVSRQAAAYRSRERATALVLGSPSLSRAALRRALLRGALGLGVFAGVVVGHRVAAARGSRVIFEEARCDLGVLKSCREAGYMRQSEGRIAEAVALHQQAWWGLGEPFEHPPLGDVRSCVALAEIFEAKADVAMAALYREQACERRDAVSCRELARLKLRTQKNATAYEVDRVMRLLGRACVWGDKVGCEELSALEAERSPR